MASATDLIDAVSLLNNNKYSSTYRGVANVSVMGTGASTTYTINSITPSSINTGTPFYSYSGQSTTGSTTTINEETVDTNGTLGPPSSFTAVAYNSNLILFRFNANGIFSYYVVANKAITKGSTLGSGTLSTATTAGTGPTFNMPPAAPCFAAGTLLTTSSGTVAVEDLSAGDLILAERNGVRAQAVVKWVGNMFVGLSNHPRAELVRPIRIMAEAFAPGLPVRDLVVSPDHALLMDGVLVQAKLLVNGGSIAQDTERASITYYHVELEQHSIVFAEGLPAESYLRGAGHAWPNETGRVVDLHPVVTTDTEDYAARGCAPLALDPAVVQPIWKRLAERSIALGTPELNVALTREHALRVVAGGQTIAAQANANGCFSFPLPAGCKTICLVSRFGFASDAQPWLADRRRLGVAVRAISVTAGSTAMALPLDADALGNGWWGVETNGEISWRWTNGNAEIVLPAALAVAGTLTVEVNGSLGYRTETAALAA